VPGALGLVQVPTVAPDALLHTPTQHSLSLAQMSPVCVQNEGCPEHLPLEQSLEQQSPFPEQSLPAVEQLVLSG